MTNKSFPADKRLSKILLKPEKLDIPLYLSDWKNCVLEIGFGNGEYMAFQAENSLDTLFLGIDVSRGCVMRAIKRMLKLDNIRIITGDARFLMRELFSDESFDRVYMNFPCPWPKKRHSKRRVTSPDFADTLASVLKINGYFELMTDDEIYAQSAKNILSGHNSLECVSYEHNPHRSFKTKYERKWLEMGRSVWRVRIRKKSPFTIKRLLSKSAVEENGSTNGGSHGQMHIRLDGMDFNKIDAEKINALFGKEGNSGNDAHWIFKRHFCSSSAGARLIETISSDAGFEQKFYIKVAIRDEEDKNTILVKIDDNSPIYFTPSVRCALSDLANHIKS